MISDLAILGDFIIKGYEEPPMIDCNATQARIDHIEDVSIITIVGSNERKDWERNFNTKMTSIPGFPGKIHKGFYLAYAAGRDAILTEAAKLKSTDKAFVIQGHSQAAPVAQLLAYAMRNLGYNIIRVILWADPRLGNKEFVDRYNLKLADNTVHIINQGDPVPTIPFAFCGYRRTGGIMHYWTIDGECIDKPPISEMWTRNIWAWAKWRLTGHFDFASDDFHSAYEYVKHYNKGL